ncbi:hypothetical protein LELG_00560 [Lodderomyces elongisporus NRRL YB-4239]|uniref:ubiquitinyl hydrolase 1 n=1 Tax=Lodderomyces elongisporus (strain ATCC 11503 / CBS 2605 / JCM 1781 / NBRC 1676 / NRRL YB-4239) TaxID=379508 RepID=A5DT74_LODEL|nr:hypothetical protein LELG_00560 [Lodderomyces elongisporus NRRL YB-4239]
MLNNMNLEPDNWKDKDCSDKLTSAPLQSSPTTTTTTAAAVTLNSASTSSSSSSSSSTVDSLKPLNADMPPIQGIEQNSNDSNVNNVNNVDNVITQSMQTLAHSTGLEFNNRIDTLARDNATDAMNHRDGEDELREKRDVVRKHLHNFEWKIGDECYIVEDEYLSRFFNLETSSFIDLKNALGPVNSQRLVDSSGQLYSEQDELIKTVPIPQTVFDCLSAWFGIVGQPVVRSMIFNPETGKLEVERWPIVFFLHILGKKPQQLHFRSGNPRHLGQSDDQPIVVSFSRTQTFTQLARFLIRYVAKTSIDVTDDVRLWFFTDSREEEFTHHITVAKFVTEVENKRLVLPGIYDKTLESEGVVKPLYHILLEVRDKKPGAGFPVDTFVKQNLELPNETSRDGVGRMGFSNLGNTCYMNSALQCLLHVPEVNKYFHYGVYRKELNVDNPLGYHGNIANSFGTLLKSAFDPLKHTSSILPRDFKLTIGRYSSVFSGYLQQDSQEFLSWLLDALHEDLNRIKAKPYCEKPELNDDEISDWNAIVRLADTCWKQHLQRNDSVITDLFTGLYQSTLVCPDCNKTSITFDPFNDLTLPLPISKKWYHTFTIVDLSSLRLLPTRVMRLEVELQKTSNYDALVAYLAKYLKVPLSFLFIYELFQNSIYADFQADYNKNKFMPIGDIIRDADDILVYIIPHDVENDIILPVYNAVEDEDKLYQMVHYFGLPLFVTLDKSNLASFGTIKRKLLEVNSALTSIDLVDEYENHRQRQDNFVAKSLYQKLDFANKSVAEDEMINSGEETDDDRSRSEVNGESKGESENGYDSDVSMADPYVRADFGFDVLYTKEQNYRLSSYLRNRGGMGHESRMKLSSIVVNVPLHKPNIKDFKKLVNTLPELKRKFYLHEVNEARGIDPREKSPVLLSETQLQTHSQTQTQTQMPVQTDTQTQLLEQELEQNSFPQVNPNETTQDDYVVVERSATGDEENTEQGVTNQTSFNRPLLPERVQQMSQINLSDEDTESEVNLGSLFGSSSNLPLPNSSSYFDSTKPSNINSPIEMNANEIEVNDYSNGNLVDEYTILVCKWDAEVYQKCFTNENPIISSNLSSLPQLPNKELEQNKAKFERQRKSRISLAECLKYFSTPELLGEHDLWYCPRCKAHKRATKTIQLWSAGDILTIHLKRFHSARAFSDKIDVVIDFPILGLDISDFVSNPTIKKEDCVYDLIAVDNHYGGLGGGHYTASVKNFCDDKWYYFNDSRVTEISDPEEVITSAAYLLFYRKRAPNADLGGDKLSSIISNEAEAFNSMKVRKEAAIKDVEGQIELFASGLKLGADDYEEKYEDNENEEKKSCNSDNKASSNASSTSDSDRNQDRNDYEEEEEEDDDENDEDDDDDDDDDATPNLRKQRINSKDYGSLLQMKRQKTKNLSTLSKLEDDSPVSVEFAGDTRDADKKAV